jgi:phosphoribosylglycinamide formyltransferase 1
MKTENKHPKAKVAMLASGSGTNVENFIQYFKDHPVIEVSLVISNNQDAKVLQRASSAGITNIFISREKWLDGRIPLEVLKKHNVDFVILAGFLQLIAPCIIEAYNGKIVNIHPALLPKHGGKGMYGMNVHQAVISSGDSYSGITIHLVNHEYDKGEILFQEKVELRAGDTPESLAEKIHQLEYEYFPKVVEKMIIKQLS